MGPKITVEIWADIICPWCLIGKTRFMKALERSSHRDRFEVVHRAFRLAEGESVRPVEQALAERYRRSADQVGRMFDDVEATAAEEGLKYRLRGTLFGDTVDAHRMVLWAARQGLQDAFLDRLYRAYFTEGESLFDRGTLEKLAVQAGAEGEGARKVLESSDYLREVLADEKRASEIGVRGVPFFVFGDKYALSGAQPIELFERAIEQIASESGSG